MRLKNLENERKNQELLGSEVESDKREYVRNAYIFIGE